MSRISGDKQAVFATLEPRRKLDLVNFHQDFWDISEFTQQDGRKKRTTKRLTNVTELLLACFVGNSLNIDVFFVFVFFLLFYKKICLKECVEVWQKVFSNEFIFKLTKQGLPSSFLSKFTIYFGRAGLLLVNFFLVSPATVPEFFAKINSS